MTGRCECIIAFFMLLTHYPGLIAVRCVHLSSAVIICRFVGWMHPTKCIPCC